MPSAWWTDHSMYVVWATWESVLESVRKRCAHGRQELVLYFLTQCRGSLAEACCRQAGLRGSWHPACGCGRRQSAPSTGQLGSPGTSCIKAAKLGNSAAGTGMQELHSTLLSCNTCSVVSNSSMEQRLSYSRTRMQILYMQLDEC